MFSNLTFTVLSFQSVDGEAELIVTGFSQKLDKKGVRSKLQKLASNTGGKVVSVTEKYALVRFKSQTSAKR